MNLVLLSELNNNMCYMICYRYYEQAFFMLQKLTPTLIHLSNPITDTHKVTCSNFEIMSEVP